MTRVENRRREKRKKQTLKRVVTQIIITILMFVLLYCILHLYEELRLAGFIDFSTIDNTGSQKTELASNDAQKLSIQEYEQMISKISNDTDSLIVGISKVKQSGEGTFLEDGIEKLGLGTGIVVSKEGYILTTITVSGKKYSKCYINLDQVRSYEGTVVWLDEQMNLAIIKCNMKLPKAITLGDSDLIQKGEILYSVVNPTGYDYSKQVSTANVNQKNKIVKFKETITVQDMQNIPEQDNYINDDNSEVWEAPIPQDIPTKEIVKETYLNGLIGTDIEMKYMNMGAAIVNKKGQLVGIHVMKDVDQVKYQYIISINLLKPVIERIEKENDYKEAYLGIEFYDNEFIPYMIKDETIKKGIYVAFIQENSPINKEFVKVGDIVTKVDNIELIYANDLKEYIYTKNVGDEITLKVLRDNQEKEVRVTLGNKG